MNRTLMRICKLEEQILVQRRLKSLEDWITRLDKDITAITDHLDINLHREGVIAVPRKGDKQ